ncbi:MAG: GIY-YIG nuclease family protein [Candidatus Peregrinibacteria bacterium]
MVDFVSNFNIGASPSGKAPRPGGAYVGSNMYYTYILQSGRDNRLYIGQTNDIEDRIVRHNKGEVTATKNRRPLKLLAMKSFETRAEAIKMERYLKSLKGGNEFKKILNQWGVAKR